MGVDRRGAGVAPPFHPQVRNMSALPPDEPGQDGQTSLESQQLQQLAQGHAAAAAAAGDVHVGGPGEGPRKGE